MNKFTIKEPVLVSFLFLDVTEVNGARCFFENALGFPIAENRFHPPHHIHGIFKFDAGSTLLSLNKARPQFDQSASDYAKIRIAPGNSSWTETAAQNGWISSVTNNNVAVSNDNHVFEVQHCGGTDAKVLSVDYLVSDLERTREFCERAFCLEVYAKCDRTLVAETDTLSLRFYRQTTSHRRRRKGQFLTVLHTNNLAQRIREMESRGITFLSEPQDSQIGRTIRFADPDGHHFCLYQPSLESLSWESGPTLKRLTALSKTKGPKA